MTRSNSASRRETITCIGSLAIAGTAGCTSHVPGIGGDDSSKTLPPIVEGWAELQHGEGTKVLFRFADEVISFPVASEDIKDRLAKQIAPPGVTLSPESVDIPGTDTIPESHRVEGIAHRDDSTKTSKIAGITHYQAPGFQVTRQEATLEVNGEEVKIFVPVEDPTYHLYSPKGYSYNLPEDHEMVQRNAEEFNVGVSREKTNNGLFSYGGLPTNLTIPEITHTDYPGLAGIRQTAEYRSKLIANWRPLIDDEEYSQSAVNSILKSSQNLQAEFLSSSIESLLLYHVPSGASMPLDLVGAHKGLEATHEDFDSTFRELSRQMDFTVSNTLFGRIVTEDQNTGLEFLLRESRKNFYLHNPIFASAPSEELFNDCLSMYTQSLENQINEFKRIHRLLNSNSGQNKLSQELISFSYNIVDELLSIINSERTVLP